MGVRVGIDIGGTNIYGVATDDTGSLIHGVGHATEDDGTDAWKANVRTVLDALIEAAGTQPESVGLCAPGIAAPDGSEILWMPERLHGLEQCDWTAELECAAPVRVLNDAQAALLAEVWLGAAQHTNNAVLLTLGTGVGGAIWCDGRLLRGHMGRAGHLGHISLDPAGERDIVNTPGSLEDAIGGCTLEARTAGRYTDTLELVHAYEGEDAFATEVWLHSVRALAAGIVSLVNAVDPEIVILGGGIAGAGDALLDPLDRYLDTFEWRPGGRRVSVVTAHLDDRAGACGAAYFGMTYEDLRP